MNEVDEPPDLLAKEFYLNRGLFERLASRARDYLERVYDYFSPEDGYDDLVERLERKPVLSNGGLEDEVDEEQMDLVDWFYLKSSQLVLSLA